MFKNLDIKTIAIIVLGVALIISFIFGQKYSVDDHSDEINNLKKSNATLQHRNDSLISENVKIDFEIKDINKKLKIDSTNLVSTQKELDVLKKKQNGIFNRVKSLSSGGVSN